MSREAKRALGVKGESDSLRGYAGPGEEMFDEKLKGIEKK